MTRSRRGSDERTRKSVRMWIISRREAAAALKLSDRQFAALVEAEFIKPSARKGFFLLGGLIDGYAAAARAGYPQTASQFALKLC